MDTRNAKRAVRTALHLDMYHTPPAIEVETTPIAPPANSVFSEQEFEARIAAYQALAEERKPIR